MKKAIPVNTMTDDSGGAVAIERISFDELPTGAEKQSHRHDRHSFFLLEKGTVDIEIDFRKYKIKPSSIIYMHPDQVHRITAFQKVMVSSWAIDNENLNPEYLQLLEDISPAQPLVLQKETFSLISETVALCLKFSERREDQLYRSLLKDGCNALVALVISQYAAQGKTTGQPSRYEVVTKAFRQLLERNYTSCKSPAAYAQKLHLSVPYLNECVKNTTGYPVSHHIQQRVILEAKRLLYHSGQSVKEIATVLGYDDYPYFSRLFTKIAGMTALAFRDKNCD